MYVLEKCSVTDLKFLISCLDFNYIMYTSKRGLLFSLYYILVCTRMLFMLDCVLVSLPIVAICWLETFCYIIPTQCFTFFDDFDWSVGKIKWFLHFNKNRAYEYLISALVSQC